ncbi:MAG: CHAD domain-containing protein [Marinobacter sp.]
MRYRLSPNGNLSKHLTRLVRSINDDIALSLIHACRDPETGVHEARKGCKEIRAILRLVKPNMEQNKFAAKQDFYRKVSGKLAGNRDAMVRQKTWNNLVVEASTLQGKIDETVTLFLDSQEALNPIAEKGRDFFVDLALDVEQESATPKNWDLPKSLSDLVPNIKKIYRKARDAEMKAKDSDDIEHFHKFRKRSKDLFYCMRVLRPMFGKGLKSMVSDLENLTEAQGLANDHAVLLDYLCEHRPSLNLEDTEWEQVNDCITLKLLELQRLSHKQAKALLSGSPGTFIKQLLKESR